MLINTYPETTLKAAREKRNFAKKQSADGIDPCLDRKIKKMGAAEHSFKAIALEWYAKNRTKKSDSHKKRTLSMLENNLFPWIGGRPVAEIKALDLLIPLRIFTDQRGRFSDMRLPPAAPNMT